MGIASVRLPLTLGELTLDHPAWRGSSGWPSQGLNFEYNSLSAED